MRCSFALVAALGLAVSSGAWGAEPEDQYLGICNLIREADLLLPVSRAQEALPRYHEAQEALQKLQKAFPDWNAELVGYRLGYLTNRIANLSNLSAKAGTPDGGPAPAPPARVDWEPQLVSLQEQVRQLQSDKALLQAKLKEALGVVPSASDPRELARLQVRVEVLEKENALLTATVAQMRLQLISAAPFSPVDTAPPVTNLDLLLQTERARMELLEKNNPATNRPAARGGKAAPLRRQSAGQ